MYAVTFPCNDNRINDADIKSYLLEKAGKYLRTIFFFIVLTFMLAKLNSEVVELIKLTPAENFLSYRLMHSCRALNSMLLSYNNN